MYSYKGDLNSVTLSNLLLTTIDIIIVMTVTLVAGSHRLLTPLTALATTHTLSPVFVPICPSREESVESSALCHLPLSGNMTPRVPSFTAELWHPGSTTLHNPPPHVSGQREVRTDAQRISSGSAGRVPLTWEIIARFASSSDKTPEVQPPDSRPYLPNPRLVTRQPQPCRSHPESDSHQTPLSCPGTRCCRDSVSLVERESGPL